MTKLLLSPTFGEKPGGSFSPVVLCKYLFHCTAADRCEVLITSLLLHNTIFQTPIPIYCFLRDGTENEAAVSQELKNQSRRTVAFCDIHPLKSSTATDESTEQHPLVNLGKVNE